METFCKLLCNQWTLVLVWLVTRLARLAGGQFVRADEMVVPKGMATFDRDEALKHGLNAAIILAEMRGWLAYNERTGKTSHQRDGVWWLYNSPQEWREKHFPWWSEATIRRTLDELKASGLATCRSYGVHNARRWWTVGQQADTVTMQVDQMSLQFATSALQAATHTCIESASQPSSMTGIRKTSARRRGAVADFQATTPGEFTVKAETPESREGFDREQQPMPGAPIQEGGETHPPSSAAPPALPAWMRAFWDGATDEALHKMMQKHGEGKLLAACERARRAKHIRNAAGFATWLLEQGVIGDADVWADEDETTPDVIEPVEVDTDEATDEALVIPDAMREIWTAALMQLERQFDRAQFAACIQGARLVAVEGDVLTVEARSSYARDMLAGRLKRDVQRVVQTMARREVEITFVVKQEARAA